MVDYLNYLNLWIVFYIYRLKTVYYNVSMKPFKIKPDKLSKQLNNGGRDYTRELARQRDKRTCQMCGKKWLVGQRRFDVHHIVGCGYKTFHYDSVQDIPNLITYCHKCHMNLHSVRLKISTRTGQNKLSNKKSSYYKNK